MPASIDPDAVQAMGRTMKVELRKSMTMKRTLTPREVRSELSRAITERVTALEAWKSARSVALFRSIVSKGEVDTAMLDEAARTAGMRVAYPSMEEGDLGTSAMSFRWVEDPSTMRSRGRGFAEPAPTGEEASALDLIIVPGLAFDPEGYRVGYGAGLYDRTLPRYNTRTVGVAFDFQLVMELPRNEHDVPVEQLVTDKRVVRAR